MGVAEPHIGCVIHASGRLASGQSARLSTDFQCLGQSIEMAELPDRKGQQQETLGDLVIIRVG